MACVVLVIDPPFEVDQVWVSRGASARKAFQVQSREDFPPETKLVVTTKEDAEAKRIRRLAANNNIKSLCARRYCDLLEILRQELLDHPPISREVAVKLLANIRTRPGSYYDWVKSKIKYPCEPKEESRRIYQLTMMSAKWRKLRVSFECTNDMVHDILRRARLV